MKKRVLSFILVLALVFNLLPIAAHAEASNDYTKWRQGDAAWNQAQAWPASQYPSATLRYMSEAGCLVTSIAMLLRHYNVVTDSNVNNFNPWICNEALKAAGAFDSAADLKWGYEQYAYPGFVYQGCVSYSASQLVSLFNQGYACIVKVNGSNGYLHYVAVKDASNVSNITIMDPGAGYTSLDSYGSKYEIHYYKTSGQITPTDSAPVITLDMATGGENSVYVRGWAFDPDTPEASLNIHVYVNYNEKRIGTCYADQLRTDVNRIYGCGDYHGFSAEIPYKVDGEVTCNITCYAINTTSGGINQASNSIEVTIKEDATGPVISNVQVIPDVDGYTVTCDIEDESDIKEAMFPSWTAYNGQDDLVGNDGSWPYLAIWKGKVSNGQATFRVNRSDHNNEWGTYRTDLYVYDVYGNGTAYTGIKAIIENNGPEISDVTVIQDDTGYTVSCKVSDENVIEKVCFPTWTDYNLQDDLPGAGNGAWKDMELFRGTIDGDTVTYHVNISDHNYETGLYHTHIYAYDTLGNSTCYEIDDIEVADIVPPEIGEQRIVEKTKEGFFIECEVSDNVELERVEFIVNAGPTGAPTIYEATIVGNVARCFVPFRDHNYKVNFVYHVCFNAYDANGNKDTVSSDFGVMYDDERNITYHLEGGTNHADNPQIYSVFNPYIELHTPTREGYTFIEWYILDTNNNKVTLTSTTELSGEDIDVYASWSCNHSWNSGVVVTEPTCNAKGERKYTCGQCGETKTEDIAITSHNYKEGCCTVCGAEDPDYEDVAAKIKVNTTAGRAGSTVTVDIVISDNPGMVSATLKLNFDTSVLKLVEVKDAEKLGVQSHKPELTSPYTLVWVNDTATKNYDYNGTIVTLKFEISEDAELGDYTIDLSYDYNNYDIYNVNAEKVRFVTVDGVISVIDTIIGDVNGDEVVNNLDRMILTRYLADWEGYEESIDLVAADVNGDGTVNNLDRMILTRHLADWEGYEEIPYIN